MPLDPNEYEVFPSVPVVDEFRMTDAEGFVAQLDSRWIELTCSRMNEREATTGDLSPIVLGHTDEETGENNQPQLVGFARNWKSGPFFNTGRTACLPDLWIKKINKLVIDGKEIVLTAQEVAARFPRRSSEVWTSRHEIDPISLLGATTPARDLGLLKLSRTGSLTYYSPGETMVPQSSTMSPPVAEAAAGQSAPMEQVLSALAQLTQMVQQLTTALNPAPDAAQGGTPPAPSAPPAPDAAGAAPGGSGEISDEELAQLLGGDGGAEGSSDPDASRKGDKPVQNSTGYPGGDNTHVSQPMVKLARAHETQGKELAQLRNDFNRLQLSQKLADLRTEGFDVDPKDDALIVDLAAMPPDMRDRSLERIKKLGRKTPTNPSFNLESALDKSTNGAPGRRIQTPDEQSAVIKLARDKKMSFEDAARESGFTL